MVVIVLIWGAYYFLIRRYNNQMKEFHYFLASYRQTPRSRFIKKYQPNQEPIYEENSTFERSQLSSVVGALSKVDISKTHDIISI